MANRVELSAFLNELISIVKKKFEVYDGNIKSMRKDIKRLSDSQGDTSISELKNRIKILENTLNSMKARTQVDSSMLKVLESDDSERRY
jgi:prefoldin subunit 5